MSEKTTKLADEMNGLFEVWWKGNKPPIGMYSEEQLYGVHIVSKSAFISGVSEGMKRVEQHLTKMRGLEAGVDVLLKDSLGKL